MKTELLDKTVMVMYDIRGIQDYIFHTNKVRDMIGASLVVEHLLETGLQACSKQHPEIEMEQIYIGGGNACVMFSNGKDASVFNRALALWVQKETYSLQLAVAVVEKTDSYAFDYDALQQEMARVKMKMLRSGLIGAFPVVEREAATGYPISALARGPVGMERVSQETFLKRKKLEELEQKNNLKFDELVDEKGIDSTLAVVHIDGNNMGKRIRALMEHVADYDQAKERMKRISQNINQSFQEAFAVMETEMAQLVGKKDKPFLRKIILAGDDITFVCTGKYAIALVESFVRALRYRVLYEACSSQAENVVKNGFSVCAGIAFMHSHFPFSDAYQIAESCCQNAKQMAKQAEKQQNGIVGNWIDFQICKEVQTVYLTANREKNYRLAGGEYLLKRPYYIPFLYDDLEPYRLLDQKNAPDSILQLKTQIQYLRSKESGLVQSDLKELRNTYALGSDAMHELLTFLESRQKYLTQPAFDEALDGQKIANWYDALEIYELYEQIQKGGYAE